MDISHNESPIVKVDIINEIELFIKREDLNHPTISGNKFWKLYYSVQEYFNRSDSNKMLITFGGAYSNHILALSYVGKIYGIPTLGIIRGEELIDRINENPTLKESINNEMQLQFVSREQYRDKSSVAQQLNKDYPNALIIPEGGTTELAVKGISHMLGTETFGFEYLCVAVGTGGTIAGLSKYASESQKVIGFSVVKDASLYEKVKSLSKSDNFELVEAEYGKYGLIDQEVVSFINEFFQKYKVPLDPLYTGKAMLSLVRKINEGYFKKGSKILFIHTGGLQGIRGANLMLAKKSLPTIKIDIFD